MLHIFLNKYQILPSEICEKVLFATYQLLLRECLAYGKNELNDSYFYFLGKL